MKERLYINALGMCNPLGSNRSEVAEKLFSGAQDSFTLRKDLLHEGDIFVGEVKFSLPSLSSYPAHFQSRNNQLALHAFNQIEDVVAKYKEQYGSHRVGVILGTSTSGIEQGEQAMLARKQQGRFPENYDYRVQEVSNVAEFICYHAEIKGYSSVISTACSSSAKTFITAAEMIELGVIDVAIVGGIDSLCGMTINGFSALDSTSAGICKPSSLNRDGINIGESATLAVLSKHKAPIRFYAGGESSDAHHMSAPHPDGKGAYQAMHQALEQANLTASDIDYINLHGTATPKNDEMEATAVSNLFPNRPYASSSKGNIGHTLGAAGATELAFCCLVLEHQKLAPHLWDKVVDPNIAQLNWVTDIEIEEKIEFCLSNSFAFGGNNVSLIIGLEHD